MNTKNDYHLNCKCDECEQVRLEAFKNPDPMPLQPGEMGYIHKAEAKKSKTKYNQTKDLNDWWVEQAEAEAAGVVPKAIEYSAYDLEMIGKTIADMIKWEGEHGRQEHTELACWFYIVGKIGRAVGAIKEGRLPSDDTVHDLNVYGRMIARTREKGGWPS